MSWTSEYTVTFIVEAEHQAQLPKSLSEALADGLPKEWFSFNSDGIRDGIDDWRIDSIWQESRRTYARWRQT